MANWLEREAALARITQKTLFFVGGAPRSGTTWVQQILDAHPDISCRGEGLFQRQLANPIATLIDQRRDALQAKNAELFRHTGGYPLPDAEDAEFLLGTAVLLALERQSADKPCLAVGEKTPENVFLFPRLKRLFPKARLINVARDPRDVLTSAWHLFQKPDSSQDQTEAKQKFIALALPSLSQGFRAMFDLERSYPGDCMTITYEALQLEPEPGIARLYDFLGMSSAPDIVSESAHRTSFAAQSGGRSAGVEHSQSFFRKGVVGDWRSTLSEAMSRAVVENLKEAYAYFGWPT